LLIVSEERKSAHRTVRKNPVHTSLNQVGGEPSQTCDIYTVIIRQRRANRRDDSLEFHASFILPTVDSRRKSYTHRHA
jgi:hypothetical protein